MSKSVDTSPSQLANWAHILVGVIECWRFSNKEMPTKLKDTLEKVRKLTRHNIFLIKFTSLYWQCKKDY